MPCIGTTLADIDINLVRSEFLPKAVASEILADDKRPLEEQLASLGFFDLRYNCPTNGCIILFGEIRGAIFRELMSNMSVSKVWIVQGNHQ